MIQCQNCGQDSSDENSFCRFCGTKFGYNQTATAERNFEIQPPSPYSWKTGEFQAEKQEARKTEQFNYPFAAPPDQNYAPTNFAPNPPLDQYQQNNQPAAIEHYRQSPFSNTNFRCPRCGTQMPPRCERKISQAGWIVFAVLLVTTGIFFWIGLLIREDVCVCNNCNFSFNN